MSSREHCVSSETCPGRRVLRSAWGTRRKVVWEGLVGSRTGPDSPSWTRQAAPGRGPTSRVAAPAFEWKRRGMKRMSVRGQSGRRTQRACEHKAHANGTGVRGVRGPSSGRRALRSSCGASSAALADPGRPAAEGEGPCRLSHGTAGRKLARSGRGRGGAGTRCRACGGREGRTAEKRLSKREVDTRIAAKKERRTKPGVRTGLGRLAVELPRVPARENRFLQRPCLRVGLREKEGYGRASGVMQGGEGPLGGL